jgi:hypothetical protein
MPFSYQHCLKIATKYPDHLGPEHLGVLREWNAPLAKAALNRWRSYHVPKRLTQADFESIGEHFGKSAEEGARARWRRAMGIVKPVALLSRTSAARGIPIRPTGSSKQVAMIRRPTR